MSDRKKGRLVLLLVYIIACGLGFWVSTVSNYPVLLKSAIAVSVIVTIIFMGSIDFNNSSVFDPWWSIAPPLMVLYYLALVLAEHSAEGYPRIGILFMIALTYSVRLTWNFLSGWPGLKHEDWMYVNFRKNSGKGYWVVSFFGIHLFPAMMVFGGTLSIWVVVVKGLHPLNLLDILAVIVTCGAILLEATADFQLRRFVLKNRETGKTMDQGLWALSRHPNYLGEILFWWGLYLFAVAANPFYWWVIIGPGAITLMFLFASIPMIEKRMLVRRADYKAYLKKVPKLIPWKVVNRF